MGWELLCIEIYSGFYKWKKNDRNFHLFSWSPMNIGNLFVEIGFKIIKVKKCSNKWPPVYQKLQRIFGWKVFLILCKLWGLISINWVQVEIIAIKPKTNK